MNINNENFVNTEVYQRFIRENSEHGTLRIRAYAANQAIPISGVSVVIRAKIENNDVVFFEGVTNESGLIDGISLPAPKLDVDNLGIPRKMTYDVVATYVPDNVNFLYKVNIYENVFVIQDINIVPSMGSQVGDF